MAGFEIDEDLIRRLSALLEETGLGEIEYADGERRIRIASQSSAAALAPPAAAAAPVPAADASAAAAAATKETVEGAVIAPMVGTVYASAEPGAAPFIRPGDIVTEGQTLLLIEAMKTFNPIRAPRGGKVARILVGDATPVEYGEVLIILE